eukprot:gnl/TRDRNA2_/TRDRNA2_98611_c0_seq1.p1 gnl/TRDRNA2_/TRDRNA2_98611_c0~~gnl/TRDRNA2_/TRDRNA2_98611_c0_seq1.p1  ORF type:complete len:346 (-),score=51.33 gnl/TRDRNA2_/TRDRNA2_98611_c0_seq1:109-1104(-)
MQSAVRAAVAQAWHPRAGSIAARAGVAALPAFAAPQVTSAACWGPQCQDTRGVARVRINRFTGVRAVKVNAPKTDWQIAAEKEFLAKRSELPTDGYLWHLTGDDVRNLTPEMQQCLSIKCGSSDDISRFRRAELIRKFQRHPFDTKSPAVQIATLTEKILRLRTHLLRHPKHHMVKRCMCIYLSRRQKYMKSLYKSDYVNYRYVCTELGIRCIRFAIPFPRHTEAIINAQAVDGDRARFLIRQRMYRAQYRPREMKEPDSKRLIRYTRHPMQPVPESHGKPKPTPQQVSRAWPYGVRQERVEGKQIIYNPTAAGRGYWPAKLGVVGGPTPE